MFDCISQVIDQLPPEARESLRIALSFAQGELGQASLLGAVEISWKSLGKGPESLQFDDPRVAGIRAVICLLHMQLYCENKQSHPECSDFTDLMSFYLRLLNNVATRLELQEALIKKWFSRCL